VRFEQICASSGFVFGGLSRALSFRGPSWCTRAALKHLRDLEAWKRRVGYGLRWIAETVFSAFKWLFGEHIVVRSVPNRVREMLLKALLYNLFTSLNPAARADVWN
jgi:hypothetical protein